MGIPQGEIANRGIPADLLLSAGWVRELVERVNIADNVPSALEAIYELLGRMAAQSPGPRESVTRRALKLPDLTASAEAIGHGFYDYPHFSHEFSRFALTTPAQFQASRRHQEYQVVAGEPAGR